MGVSVNGGTPNSHPKIIIFSRKTHGFVGETHHFRKPPNGMGIDPGVILQLQPRRGEGQGDWEVQGRSMQTPNDRGRLGRNAGGMTAFLGVLAFGTFFWGGIFGDWRIIFFFEMVNFMSWCPPKKRHEAQRKQVSQTI